MSSIAKEKTECQICGDLASTEVTSDHLFEYHGANISAKIHSNFCSSCGSETVNQEQSLKNRRAIIAKKKVVDKIPTGKKIKEMRLAANLTQIEAGKLLGGGPVAFSKYENDDLLPDTAMSNLLKLWAVDPSYIDVLRRINNDSDLGFNKKLFFSSQYFSEEANHNMNERFLPEDVYDSAKGFQFKERKTYKENTESGWRLQ